MLRRLTLLLVGGAAATPTALEAFNHAFSASTRWTLRLTSAQARFWASRATSADLAAARASVYCGGSEPAARPAGESSLVLLLLL